MGKPWEETWDVRLRPGERVSADMASGEMTYTGVRNAAVVLVTPGMAGVLALDMDEPRARLVAAAPDLYRALESVEWTGGYGESESFGDVRQVKCCPECMREADKGEHAPDCALAAALRKARGE